MRFQFIHAADLHIDSPLASLGGKEPAVARTFARANRAAVEALIRETLESGAKFLIIAGDVFDGDWKDVSTGLFFVRQLGELHRAGVPVFIVKGNHDAESVVSRSLAYPEGVHVFDTRKAQTRGLDDLRVALHGRSFADRGVPEDFVASYPARREGWLNIGVLHTGLDGARGHESYAPCTVEDLKRFGYDYWALGHIHAAEIVARDPWVVYPGNIQGRSPRETGAKGAMRVTVEDGRIVAVEPFALDLARWAHERVDVGGHEDEARVLETIGAALGRVYEASGGRSIAARITLVGETPLHARLVAHRERLEDEARARGFQVSSECWVERLRIETRAPARKAAPPEPDSLDVDALIAEAATDPDFAAVVAEIRASVADKLPRDLQGEVGASPVALVERARDYLIGERA